mgnify:CR=1 FL=1
MKNKLFALTVSAMLLAGCSDKPRGPLEVQGKTWLLNGGSPLKLDFSERKKGRTTHLETGEFRDFKYTLKGDQLVVHIARTGSDKVNEITFMRDGERFDADRLFLSKMMPKREQK